jgi:hypothetical protein
MDENAKWKAMCDFAKTGVSYSDDPREEWDIITRPATAGPSRMRGRPGPKPTGDWPTIVAAWLIAVAADDPKRLQNADVLVTEAQSFLRDEIGWAPKEPKELRKTIVELLRFIRR